MYKSSDDLKRDSLSQTLGPNKTAFKSVKKKVHVDLFSQNMSSIFTNIIFRIMDTSICYTKQHKLQDYSN